jgi:hypothetical protein
MRIKNATSGCQANEDKVMLRVFIIDEVTTHRRRLTLFASANPS